MKRKFLVQLALVALIITMVSMTASAQNRIRISGEVIDTETKEPVANATIKMTRLESTAGINETDTTTDDSGKYGVSNIMGGDWSFEITHPDYAPLVKTVKLDYFQKNPPVNFELSKPVALAATSSVASELEAMVAEGEGLIAEQKFDEAIAVYEAFLADNPDIVLVNLYIAQAYDAKGDKNKAIELYEVVLAAEPENLNALKAIGDAHVENFDYTKGLEYYKKLVELAPDNAGFWYIAGELANGASDYDSAITYYSKFIEMEPATGRTFQAAMILGYVYSERADCDNLEKYFNMALALNNSMEADMKAEIKRCRDANK